MTIEDEEDLPYGENFHDEAEAAAWAEAAVLKRPWRPMIFDRFVTAVMGSKVRAPRVLELGSGPGFLAEHVLDRCRSVARYTLLDFSEAMLAQSRRRLDRHRARTEFIQADFKRDPWPTNAGGPFDFVFSLQAVHELRHKRHAPRLYAQVHSLLSPAAQLVVCDHLPEGAITPRHRVLYMSIAEYLAVLANAGFSNAEVVWSGHAMAMYRAHA
jgi:SAM-dependent methyltransferase